METFLVSDSQVSHWRTCQPAFETFPSVTLNEIVQKASEVETPDLSRTWWDFSSSNMRHQEAGDPLPTPIRKHPRFKFLYIFLFFFFLQKALMGWNTSWTYLLGGKEAFIDMQTNLTPCIFSSGLGSCKGTTLFYRDQILKRYIFQIFLYYWHSN